MHPKRPRRHATRRCPYHSPAAPHFGRPALMQVPSDEMCPRDCARARWPQLPGWHNPDMQRRHPCFLLFSAPVFFFFLGTTRTCSRVAGRSSARTRRAVAPSSSARTTPRSCGGARTHARARARTHTRTHAHAHARTRARARKQRAQHAHTQAHTWRVLGVCGLRGSWPGPRGAETRGAPFEYPLPRAVRLAA